MLSFILRLILSSILRTNIVCLYRTGASLSLLCFAGTLPFPQDCFAACFLSKSKRVKLPFLELDKCREDWEVLTDSLLFDLVIDLGVMICSLDLGSKQAEGLGVCRNLTISLEGEERMILF